MILFVALAFARVASLVDLLFSAVLFSAALATAVLDGTVLEERTNGAEWWVGGWMDDERGRVGVREPDKEFQPPEGWRRITTRKKSLHTFGRSSQDSTSKGWVGKSDEKRAEQAQREQRRARNTKEREREKATQAPQPPTATRAEAVTAAAAAPATSTEPPPARQKAPPSHPLSSVLNDGKAGREAEREAGYRKTQQTVNHRTVAATSTVAEASTATATTFATVGMTGCSLQTQRGAIVGG